MSKSAALLLVLFLIVSCLIVAKPAFSAAAVAEDKWTAKAPMQQARAGLGVVAINGKIYAIGGSTASGSYPPDAIAGDFVGTNEEYNPSTDTWTYKTSMPTPRGYFATAAYQNKIYCIGGAVGFSVDERTGFYSYIASGVNEVYDTITDTWETKKPIPYPELRLQAQVVNGKIYVVGGASTYVYDPENGSWALKKQAPVSHPWPVLVDKRLVVSGEYSPLWDSPEQKILVYDTETDSWSECTSGPIAVVQGTAGATTGVKAPQKVYVLGLMVEAILPTLVNQVYDPKTDTWATANSMPTTRSDFGVVVVNDILYAIGGYLRGASHVTPTAVNEQYTPLGYGTVPPRIWIISPIHGIYNEASVPLTFHTSEACSSMSYCLDGQENVAVAGNATLSGLPKGFHNLTVYVTDVSGSTGVSDRVYFSVDVPESFPTFTVAISVATVAVVGVGLLVYFKKRRAKSGGKP